MTSLHLKPIAATLAIACSSLLCQAQQADEVSLQFISFPKSENTEPLELIVGENKTVSVELPTNSLSKIYKVNRNSKWTLGKTLVGDDGNTSFRVYGESPSLASKSQLILVMRSGAEDEDGLTLTAIDYDPAIFKGGSYLFINAVKPEISGTIGETKFEIDPTNHSLVSPKPANAEENENRLLIHVNFNMGEKESPFYSSKWRFSEKARSIVFFYYSPDTESVRIHTIRDYLP